MYLLALKKIFCDSNNLISFLLALFTFALKDKRIKLGNIKDVLLNFSFRREHKFHTFGTIKVSKFNIQAAEEATEEKEGKDEL